MKKLSNLLMLTATILFSGCAAFEYGLILNDHRGDLMSLRTESGKRFYDVYLDTLFYSPKNASVARKHLKEHSFPDFIYCEGQLSNYLIYGNEPLRIFHFDQSSISLLKISPVTASRLPSAVQSQLSLIESQRKQQMKQQMQHELLKKQQIERQELEKRWRNEYLLEVSESVAHQ